jgi:hypothetical protein
MDVMLTVTDPPDDLIDRWAFGRLKDAPTVPDRPDDPTNEADE